MLRLRQFSILGLLCLITIVGMTLSAPYFWCTILLIEVIAFFYCVEVLSQNLPTAIRRSQRANCVRLDGSWSKRRERIERRSVAKLKSEIIKALLLVVIPANVLIWFVNAEVIPLSIGVNAMSKFDGSQQEWKSNLRKEEQQYDRWLGLGTPQSELTSRKRWLWNSWPILLATVFAIFFAALIFVCNAYFHALKDLSDAVKFRGQQHRLREMHEAVRDAPA